MRNRKFFQALHSFLILPNEKTIISFFGKFGSARNEKECIQVVSDVFSCLDELDRFVFIPVVEIYIKPAIR